MFNEQGQMDSKILEAIEKLDYPCPARFFIIRHGESMGNAVPEAHHQYSDPGLPLTKLGAEQLKLTGRYLYDRLSKENLAITDNDESVLSTLLEYMPKIRAYRSTWVRASQSAEIALSEFGSLVPFRLKDQLAIVEQDWGDWEGVETSDDYDKISPIASKRYQNRSANGQKLFAPMPHGESNFQVWNRVKNALDTYFRAMEEHGTTDFIIFTHGATARALVTALTGGNAQDWLELRNPANGSVWLVEQEATDPKGYTAEKMFRFINKGIKFNPNDILDKESIPHAQPHLERLVIT